VTREQVVAVLEFGARSLDAPPTMQQPAQTVDAYDSLTTERPRR